ncbi:MAG: choice-of-anchor A family protein, partial [Phaeodactylibacter sp.]|nr:choice-of-anchor A family protein [Phaeodactylibacter sp.]
MAAKSTSIFNRDHRMMIKGGILTFIFVSMFLLGLDAQTVYTSIADGNWSSASIGACSASNCKIPESEAYVNSKPGAKISMPASPPAQLATRNAKIQPSFIRKGGQVKSTGGSLWTAWLFPNVLDNMFSIWKKDDDPGNMQAALSRKQGEMATQRLAQAQLQTVETLPSGTLIIPMDNTLQGSGGDFNLRAYGLAVHLLHANVPLKWIIQPGKAKDGIDFSATAQRVAPTASGSANRDFRAGPIAIFPGFETEALAVISSFNAGPGTDVNVYELTQSVDVDVYATLTHKPKAAALNNGGNADIHTDIYDEAGLVVNTHYALEDAINLTSTSCYTFASEPHTKPSDINTTIVNAVRSFVQAGGNFLAQCEGVEAYANSLNGSLLATYASKPGIGGTIVYDNHDEPFAQFQGLLADEGGSVESFKFVSNPAGGQRTAYDSNDGDNFKAYVGLLTGVTTGAGGYVHYLAGHEYKSGITGTNGKRHLLNALLRPAERPEVCNLSLGPVAQDDTGTIDCGTSSVIIDVLANDSDPLGGGLTVNLIGNGSSGTFVNNGNGTVTYTGDVDGFWAGDQVDYEACSGAVCSQATITITSSNPSQLTISGTVFEDLNTDGLLDGGESGPGGVTVNLYQDNNNDNMVDGGDTFISSQTTGSGGGYEFTISTPPTSATNTTLTSTKATSIYQDNVNEGYGSCGEMYLEEDPGYLAYPLVEFDLSGLPTGCTVTSATLRLVRGTSGGGDNFNFQVRRVTSSWEEGNGDCDDSGSNTTGATWNQRAPGTPWATAGGDFAGTVYATGNGGDGDATGTVYNLDITTLVNEWLNGTPNNGLVIVPAAVGSSGGDDWFGIYSDDAASANRPQLQVSIECVNNSNYVLEVNTGTLPVGATLTTDNVETADFTALGQLDCNNNFGFENDDQPVAVDDSNTTDEDTPVNGDASTNDTPSADGGNVWSLVGPNGGAANGTVTMNPNGTYTYTPGPEPCAGACTFFAPCQDGSCPVITDYPSALLPTGPPVGGVRGTDANFNLIVEGDFTVTNGGGAETEGRIAVGGHFIMDRSFYGTATSGGGTYVIGPDGENNLIVRGDIQRNELTAGTLGNAQGGSSIVGNIFVGGSVAANITTNSGNPATVIANQGAAAVDALVNFNSIFAQLDIKSDCFAGLPATGTFNAGSFTLEGDGSSDVQVFNLSASDLTTLSGQNLLIDNIPAGATIIVNVTASGTVNWDVANVIAGVENDPGYITFGAPDGDVRVFNLLFNFNTASQVNFNS